MTVRQFKVPFFTSDGRYTRDGPPHPEMVGYETLTVVKAGGGCIAVEVPYRVLQLMGEGPYKIFLAAARLGATLKWNDTGDMMPVLVRRFFEMLGNDLGFDEPPIFKNDFARKCIVVSGITGLGCRRGSAPWLPHIDSPEEARRRRVAILAGD